jgi:hypothetical protein
VDKRSASTIGLAADTLLAAATQIWNCWIQVVVLALLRWRR